MTKEKEVEISEEELQQLKQMEEQRLPTLQQLTPSANEQGESEIMTTDEALAKITMHLANPPNIKMMTEANLREIILIAQLYSVAVKIEDDMLLTFLKAYMELKVSNRREGRRELIDMGKAGRMMEQDKSKLAKFLSGFR